MSFDLLGIEAEDLKALEAGRSTERDVGLSCAHRSATASQRERREEQTLLKDLAEIDLDGGERLTLRLVDAGGGGSARSLDDEGRELTSWPKHCERDAEERQ